MNRTNINKYMEHPLVRAYLRDLDAALGDEGVDEADVIRESIREHFVSEFALADHGIPVEVIVEEVLAKLGPVESIADGMAVEAGSAEGRESLPRRSVAAMVATVLSVLLAPFAVGVSGIVSVIVLIVAIRSRKLRGRAALIVVNSLVVVIALAYLVLALTTAAALFEPVQGSS